MINEVDTKRALQIETIHSLTYKAAEEMREHYIKAAALFSSRGNKEAASIYHKLARECLLRMVDCYLITMRRINNVPNKVD